MNVMLVLTPSGHSTCNLSLFNCSRKTISTKSALNIINANTDLFRRSIKSWAIRFYSVRDHGPVPDRNRAAIKGMEERQQMGLVGVLLELSVTSCVVSSYVIFVRTPNGHLTCKLSLFSCNKNTINTNRALIMKKANTELFRSSFKSAAIRSCGGWI